MDFSTISKRIDDNHYTTMEQFERDFNLVIGNCLRYNAPDTIYYRAALKMRDQGRPIVRAARRQVERAGIDPVTGLHTEEPPTLADREPTEEGIEKIINRSDNFFSRDLRMLQSFLKFFSLLFRTFLRCMTFPYWFASYHTVLLLPHSLTLHVKCLERIFSLAEDV